MKKMEINVTIKFIVEETGSSPMFDGQAIIIAEGPDGQKWEGGCRYSGNNELDVIRTMTRMNNFPSTIAAMAMAAAPVNVISEPAPSAEPSSFEELSTGPNEEKPPQKETPVLTEEQKARFNEQREAHYTKLHAEIQTWGYGVIRKFCTENELTVTVPNGSNKVDLANAMCQEFKDREDKVNETNQ